MRCENSSVKASEPEMLPSTHSASMPFAFGTTQAKYRHTLLAKPGANLMMAFLRFFCTDQGHVNRARGCSVVVSAKTTKRMKERRRNDAHHRGNLYNKKEHDVDEPGCGIDPDTPMRPRIARALFAQLLRPGRERMLPPRTRGTSAGDRSPSRRVLPWRGR